MADNRQQNNFANNKNKAYITRPQREKQQRHYDNWFDILIQRYGEDFLNIPRSQELADELVSDVSMTRIFRELIKGRIDVVRYAKYITNYEIIRQLVDTAAERKNESMYILGALDYYINAINIQQNMTSPTSLQIIGNIRNKIHIKNYLYTELHQALYNVMATGDPAYILPLSSNRNITNYVNML